MLTTRSIWNQMPVLRLLICLIIGIVLGIYTSHEWAMRAATIFLYMYILGMIISYFSFSPTDTYRYKYFLGSSAVLAVSSLGYLLCYYHSDSANPHQIALNYSAEATIVGTVIEPPILKEKVMSALIQVAAIDGEMMESKISASIAMDSASERLQYGDRVVIKGMLKPYDMPRNPNQFDYKQYQLLHHITHCVYVKNNYWMAVDSNKGSPILAKAYNARAYFLSILRRYVHEPNNLAVAAAIMLGYRDYLNEEIMMGYASTGVMHVLSVSGLHVGILLLGLNFLLGWMNLNRKLRILKGIVIILILLLYAVITGLSPPVLRSVLMIAMLEIASIMDRRVSGYNVVAISCFALLIYDPFLIADVGFQLSYIAVLGLLYGYKRLYQSIYSWRWFAAIPVNWLSYIIRNVYALLCVSLVAQVATFPISIYYFHQFPIYFLVTNLLVVVWSNVILVAGFVLFIIGFIPTLADLIGPALNEIILIQNWVIFRSQSLPYSLLTGIEVTSVESILLYLLIGACCWFAASARATALISGLLLLAVLLSSFALHSLPHERQTQLVVYNIPRHSALAIIDDHEVYFKCDSTVSRDSKLRRMNIQNHWYQMRIEDVKSLDSFHFQVHTSMGSFITINRRIILLANTITPSGHGAKSPSVDYLILSDAIHGSLDEWCRVFSPRKVIFDSSCKPWDTKRYIAYCQSHHLAYFDTHAAAFVEKL